MRKIILITYFFILNSFVYCQPIEIVNKLTASDGLSSDQFSYSVSINGLYALIGARYDDDNGSNSGSAYIFQYDGGNWVQLQKLLPPDGAADDNFGASVSISNNFACMGAAYDDDNAFNSGSVYIFHFNGSSWDFFDKLTADDPGENDFFGSAVSISNNDIIVGAYGDDDFGTECGSAYLFHYNGTEWSQTGKFTAPDAAAGDNFGYSVDIKDNNFIVGADGNDNAGLNSGSAYIFSNIEDNWQFNSQLNSSDAITDQYFGFSVALYNDYALIGAYGDDDRGETAGAAYLFKRNNESWESITKFLASDGSAYDYFGVSVDIYENYAVIGAFGDNDNGNFAGAAYSFEKDGDNWTEMDKILPSDGAAGDYFGRSVSITEFFTVINAYTDDDMGTNSGSAYIYGPPYPTVTIQPVSVFNVCNEQYIQYTIDGDYINTYQWLVSIDGGTNWTELTDNSVYSGSQTNSLSFNAIISMNNSLFKCRVSNIRGFIESEVANLIFDTDPPTLTIQNVEISLDEYGFAYLNPSDFIVSANDNCPTDTTLSVYIVDCSNVGSPLDVDITLTDINGNTTIETAQVNVSDDMSPILSVQNYTVNLNEIGYASISAEDIITYTADNCDLNDTTISQTEFTCDNVNNPVEIIISVSDIHSNSTSLNAVITVLDPIIPVIECIDNQTINLLDGENSYIVTGTEFDPISVYDNCSNFNLVNDFNNMESLAGAEIPVGTSYIEWIVSDIGGNSNSCVFSVTVNEYVDINDNIHSQISLSPNPPNEFIRINAQNLNIIQIKLFNITGVLLYESNIYNPPVQNTEIQVENLSPGLYYIQIFTDRQTFLKKFIIK